MKSLTITSEYKSWLGELKLKIRQSQIKASIRVNTTLLELYWDLGADMVNKRIESTWGSGIIQQLSADLRTEFPDMQGFSTTNLWYIKKWYLFYNQENTILHQAGGEFGLPISVPRIPWRHHVEIITKCKSVEEALFYAHKTIEEGWSRSTMLHFIEADYYTLMAKQLPILVTHCLLYKVTWLQKL